MKFDWTNFTSIDFTDYCAKVENDIIESDDYVGCVRVGDLCFDLLVRTDGEDKWWLSYDLYVGGVDTGYGYSDVVRAKKIYNGEPYDEPKDPQYPYDYAEGGDFEGTMISMTYEDFQKHAEAEFKKYIKTWPYKEVSLIKKANEPLNIW